MDNPFLQACNQMFKDFENVQKEDKTKGQQQQPNPGAGLFGFMDGAGDANDENFKNMLNNMAKDLLNGDQNM